MSIESQPESNDVSRVVITGYDHINHCWTEEVLELRGVAPVQTDTTFKINSISVCADV